MGAQPSVELKTNSIVASGPSLNRGPDTNKKNEIPSAQSWDISSPSLGVVNWSQTYSINNLCATEWCFWSLYRWMMYSLKTSSNTWNEQNKSGAFRTNTTISFWSYILSPLSCSTSIFSWNSRWSNTGLLPTLWAADFIWTRLIASPSLIMSGFVVSNDNCIVI